MIKKSQARLAFLYIWLCGFLIFSLALFMSAVSLKASEPCVTIAGDTVCDGSVSPEEQAKLAQSKKENKKAEDTAARQLEQLKAALGSFPKPLRTVLMQDTADFLKTNTDQQKFDELLKKLKALETKSAELSKNACGLPADIAAKTETQGLIHNTAAQSLQDNKITSLSFAQMGEYLKTLEKNVCSKLKENVSTTGEQVAAQAAAANQVMTNDYIEKYDPVKGAAGSVDTQSFVPPGRGAASYPPGSTEASMANPDYKLPENVPGAGGDKIAACAKQMIGYTTADVPATNRGRLGCILAVSRILNCAGYGVGIHLGNTIYDALQKDSCYKLVLKGHLPSDGAGLEPGDVLITKMNASGVAGHGGIYYGNGLIISNDSNSGTIRENFNTRTWRSVTNRWPDGSGVFRRVCK